MRGAQSNADALYDDAPCALLVADGDGLLLRANATACRWLGFDLPELVGLLRIQELMTVGARLFHHTHCQPLLQLRGSVAELQIDLRHRDGTRLPMLVNIARRHEGSQVRDQWALFMATERQSYERELRNARKAAEEALEARRDAELQLTALNATLSAADRRKDEFLATLSHELRNPLAPMRSALEVMRHMDGAADAGATQARVLSVFERQLHHMTHLVDDLMEVSRITQDKMALRREQVDLAALARAAVSDTAILMEHAHHKLDVELPPHPVSVDADPTRLNQVIVNLLTNAAKYTPDGGRVKLTLGVDDGSAVLSVRDTGIGLPAHALATVFDMFSQLEPALERSRGGLGIGLSLVRGIVELHGGAIEAHSEGEGMGSCFTVRLPLAAKLPVPAAVPEDAPTPAPARILVVDDNADAAEMLLMALELFGCEVRAAHSASAALAMVEEFAPEVALLDIGLPDLNGYELARRLRAMEGGQHMRLIAATGWGQEKDRQRAFDAGFDHHLTKPIDFERLRTVLSPAA